MDITFRALEILRTVDEVICEERKVGSRFLNITEFSKIYELLTNIMSQSRSIYLLLKAGKQLVNF